MSINSLKDIDREVLKWIDDKDLLKVCTINRKTWYEVCDDNFLKRRLNKYPGIEKYKNGNESWKRFFSRFTYYKTCMRDEFSFQYSEGNFIHADDDLPVGWASEKGHLDIVKYLVEKGANIHADSEYALREASEAGHLPVVKYLLEQGADIHAYDDYSLIYATYAGHVDVVKYLLQNGADIHNQKALRFAKEEGHTEIFKLLNNLTKN